MENPPEQEEPQTDPERVQLVEKLTIDVREGRVKTSKEVTAVLDILGPHIGPFGCSSTELEVAVEKLKSACQKINWKE